MTLYEIRQELEDALNNLEIDEETGEITNIESLEAVQGQFEEKAEAVACYKKELDAMANALKAEMDALNARKKAYESKASKLADYLAKNLTIVGQTKFETPKCKVSFRKSTAVVIDDVFDIPQEYIRRKVTEEPDKTKLKDALKDGAVFTGVRLEERQTIQIK